MIGRNKRVDRGSLFFWGPELTASVPRLLRQDLKPLDLFAVELAASVTGDSQPIDGKPAAYSLQEPHLRRSADNRGGAPRALQHVMEEAMDDGVLKNQALDLWVHGQKHHLRGDLERAIELYTKSLGLYPTTEAYTFRGWAYSFQGRVDEAIEECKKAIATDPTLGNPYNDIGSYLVKKGKLDEAIEWLEKAKTAPRYEPRHFPYMNLGRIYAQKGMVLRAIREFEAALEFHPGEPTCLSALGELRGALH